MGVRIIRSRRSTLVLLVTALVLLSALFFFREPSRAVWHTFSSPTGPSAHGDAPLTPLRGKNLRLMAVGDSVTAGPMNTNSYRQQLVKLLRGNTIDMVGSGVWGNMKPIELNRMEADMSKTIEDIHEMLKESLPQWRPNVVLLHLGTNDVGWEKDLETAPDRIRRVIDSIVDDCPDAVILVAQIIPIAFKIDKVQSFNKEVARIVARHAAAGVHILSVDMYKAFETEPHPPYFADVTHPNTEGYNLMALCWHEALQKANSLGWIQAPVAASAANEVENAAANRPH